MAQLGADARVWSPRGSDGISAVGLVAKKQQGLTEIWNRLRLSRRLLPGDQLRVRLLTASMSSPELKMASIRQTPVIGSLKGKLELARNLGECSTASANGVLTTCRTMKEDQARANAAQLSGSSSDREDCIHR